MDDRNDAPNPGATGDASPAWPEPHEWPADDASTLEVARFYRERLGFVDLRPTPAQADRDAHANYIAGEARSEWCWAHKTAEIPADLAFRMRADAQALADAVRGPIPRIAGEHRSRPTTDADLVRWFAPLPGRHAAATQHHTQRGVCVNLGGPVDRLAQIDADVGHGRADADLGGALAQTPGLRVATPRGGVHIFVQATRGQIVYYSNGALAPGIEVRTEGWALLPAGTATPGRVWTSRSRPVPPPAALLAPPLRAPRRPNGEAGGDAAATGPDGALLGRVATIVMAQHGRGDGRTQAAGALLGLLARGEGLPADVVDALAAMLVDHGAAMDWPAARVREELTRWRSLLTLGPRDAEFAAEVLETWVAQRTDGSGGKGAAWARATARSLWKTADRREEGAAGAQDLGHLGGVGDHPAPASAAPASPYAAMLADLPPLEAAAPEAVEHAAAAAANVEVSAETRLSDYVLHGPLCTCGQCKVVAPEVADAKAAKERADREAFLRRILPFSADAYPDDVADKDMERVPLRVDSLYPFRDFWNVVEENPDEAEWAGVVTGHGYGRHLARAVGGLLPGSLVAVGGAGAKIGKTHFVGQAVEGLALDAAARILGVPGYQDKPIVMVTWVTEMPKPGEVKYRMLARLFGFDAAALASSAAPEAPGIIHMAERAAAATGRAVTPMLVVEHARRIVRAFRSADEVPAPGGGYEKNPVAFYLKYLQTEVALSAFPAPTGQGRSFVDQASGVNLVGHVADGVILRRRELAERIGVAEDKITPIVVIDPGQRFIGGGESSKRELDAFLLAVQQRLCFAANGVGAVVLMTSDTTKAAAKEIDLDAFMSESGPRLAADIFAGSQAFMHIPDTILAVCSQDGGVPYRRTQFVRVLQSRASESKQVYPFTWETFCGRFRPRAPEALRDPAEHGRERGGARGKGGGRSWTPPDTGDHAPPAETRLPPYRQNSGRQGYTPRDD